MIFSFDEYELDVHDWRLRRAGEEVHIQRKAFEVLRYLIEHRDRPVSRQELLEHVWSGDAVTPAVLTVAVSKARQAIGQSSSESGRIQTEHGRGYRFIGELQTRPRRDDSSPSLEHVAEARAPSDPFVGRDAVMRELETALTTAIGGRAQLRLLEGEPGVGKTRAAEELAARAAARGIGAFWGRSHERAGMPAFWPWLNILRHCLELIGERRAVSELGQAGSDLARLVPRFAVALDNPVGTPGAIPPGADLESARYRVFDAVTRLLQLAAEQSPLVLILDDLHWGDESSIELLGYMLPEIAAARILLIGTLRDSELPPRTRNRMSLDFLSRHPSCQRIRVERLTMRDVEAYTERVLGRAAPEVSSAVFASTEGNAFFMSEALRSVTTGPEGAPVATLPDAALDIVRRRLMQLGQGTERVLAAAAVIGRSFDLALLSEVSGQAVDALRELLQPPLDHGLIVALAEPGRFAFSHGLTRRTLYDDLAIKDRAGLHLAVARALDRRLQGAGEVAEGRVADHYLRALPHAYLARAIELARSSAESLEAQFACGPAANQYERALQALDRSEQPDAATRLALLLALGRAARLGGQLNRSREAANQALELARRLGRPIELAHAAIGLRACQPLRAVPEPEVHDALSEALMVLPDEEVVLRARVLARLAGVRALQTRRLMSQRAAELAVGIEDASTRYDVLLARMHAMQTPDTLDERLELAEQAIELAQDEKQPHWRWEALLARYDVAMRRGQMERAKDALDACQDLADELAHPQLRYEVRRLRMQHRLCSGDTSDAVEREIVALAQEGLRLEAPFAELYFLAQSATLYRDRGVIEGVAEGGEHFIKRFPWAAGNARAHLAMLVSEAGDTARARAHYDQYSADELASLPHDEDFVYVVANLLQAAVYLEDRAGCERFYDLLEPYAEHNVANSSLLFYGSAHYALGRGALALGRIEQARDHLRQAIDRNRAMGNRGYEARALGALAMLERNAGDAARAGQLIDQARALTAEGLAGVQRRLDQMTPC